MYLNCRVVISNYFGWVMLQAVLAEEAPSVETLHCPSSLAYVTAHKLQNLIQSAASSFLLREKVHTTGMLSFTLHDAAASHDVMPCRCGTGVVWPCIACFPCSMPCGLCKSASMIVNRLQKRKAAKHSTLSSHGSAQKQVYSDQKPAGLARVDNFKGTTGAGDTFQLRERQHASIPSAV